MTQFNVLLCNYYVFSILDYSGDSEDDSNHNKMAPVPKSSKSKLAEEQDAALNLIPLNFGEKQALHKSIMKLSYERMMDLVALVQSRAKSNVGDNDEEFELDLSKLDIPTLRAMQQFVSDEFGIILNKAAIIEDAENQKPKSIEPAVTHVGTVPSSTSTTSNFNSSSSKPTKGSNLIPDCAKNPNAYMMDSDSDSDSEMNHDKTVESSNTTTATSAAAVAQPVNEPVNTEAWVSLMDTNIEAKPAEENAENEESSALWNEAQRNARMQEQAIIDQRQAIEAKRSDLEKAVTMQEEARVQAEKQKVLAELNEEAEDPSYLDQFL